MKNPLFLTILLAIFFGLAAGLAGQIIAYVYFNQDLAGFTLTREFDLLDDRSNLIIRDARKVVVSQDAKIEEVANSVNYSLFKVFQTSANKKPYFFLEQPVATALAVSSDGWLMVAWPSDLPVASEWPKLAADFVVVDHNQKTYEVTEVIGANSQLGNLLFLKAADLTNAMVRRTVLDQEIQAGQTLIIFGSDGRLSLGSLVDYGLVNDVLSSDQYSRKLSVLAPLEILQNAFVFNLAGDLVGVIDEEENFVAAPLLSVAWQSLLITNAPSLPFLGINYLNLSTVKFLDGQLEKGALIYNETGKPAVVKGSPADLAGLKTGDIILRVNGLELNSQRDLSAMILSSKPGDQVILVYSRAGEEKEVIITLSSTK